MTSPCRRLRLLTLPILAAVIVAGVLIVDLVAMAEPNAGRSGLGLDADELCRRIVESQGACPPFRSARVGGDRGGAAAMSGRDRFEAWRQMRENAGARSLCGDSPCC
ncbi:MAG: hypothetical protein KDG52_07985 [Rhodocyclaceae bacterium]|nr:hypothetical protein [Rhodocyclaceae bacterium]